MDFLSSLGNPIPKPLFYAADATVDIGLASIFDSAYNIDRLRQLIEDAKKWSLTIDTDSLGLAAVSWIDRQIGQVVEKCEDPEAVLTMEKIKDTVRILNAVPVAIHPWRAQNSYIRLKNRILGEMQQKAERGDYEAKRWVQAFLDLADCLHVRI